MVCCSLCLAERSSKVSCDIPYGVDGTFTNASKIFMNKGGPVEQIRENCKQDYLKQEEGLSS